jgi:hypothetical protein
MSRVPTTRSRAWLWIGLLLAIVHIVLLSGVAFFDDGHLSDDWIEKLPWVGLVVTPSVVACAGFRYPNALPWAAGISLPLAFLSLAGATLPLVLPATFYLLSYGASESPVGDAR